jgi:hypothetical protein
MTPPVGKPPGAPYLLSGRPFVNYLTLSKQNAFSVVTSFFVVAFVFVASIGK